MVTAEIAIWLAFHGVRSQTHWRLVACRAPGHASRVPVASWYWVGGCRRGHVPHAVFCLKAERGRDERMGGLGHARRLPLRRIDLDSEEIELGIAPWLRGRGDPREQVELPGRT